MGLWMGYQVSSKTAKTYDHFKEVTRDTSLMGRSEEVGAGIDPLQGMGNPKPMQIEESK